MMMGGDDVTVTRDQSTAILPHILVAASALGAEAHSPRALTGIHHFDTCTSLFSNTDTYVSFTVDVMHVHEHF